MFFDYILPENRIAHEPVSPRDHSRLMLVDRKTQSISHHHFYDLPKLLPQNSLLVRNNTKVINARFLVSRETGGRVEILLSRPLSKPTQWKALIKPLKRVREGEILTASEGVFVKLIKKHVSDDLNLVEFMSDLSMDDILENYGQLPLPPYIDANAQDHHDTYQTTFASESGALAAPTAGLHFTPELFDQLQTIGHSIAEITLHVGLGTFKPIQDDIDNHVMHEEFFSTNQATSDQLNQAKANRQPIIGIGTTVARTLESLETIQAQSGYTDIFITPGYRFKHLDGLITNFHLPKSTLLLLVGAFARDNLIRNAYEIAIKDGYRFYSFGDGMLIL